MRVLLVLASLDFWIILLYHVLGKFLMSILLKSPRVYKMCGVDDIADAVAMRKRDTRWIAV